MRGGRLGGVVLLAVALVSGCAALDGARDPADRRRVTDAGAVLPPVPARTDFSSRIISHKRGAGLVVDGTVARHRDVLQRTLERAGISATVGEDSGQWVLRTDWVSLRVDPLTGHSSTLPPLVRRLSFKEQQLERHRFVLSIEPLSDGVQVLARDAQRQAEVDLAPDSSASLLEWQERPPQVVAAGAFLRRLQTIFESAMVSRLVTRTTDVASTASQPAPGQVDVVELPSTSAAPAVQRAEVGELPDTVAAPVAPPPPAPAVPTPPALARGPDPASAWPDPTKVGAPTPQRGFRIASGEGPAARSADGYTAAAAAQVLRVAAGTRATVKALRRALLDQGVGLYPATSLDQVDTRWVEYVYDPRRGALVALSELDPKWAFSVFRRSRGRARFAFRVLAAGENQSTVYAYELRDQHRVDLTPDATITMIQWQDRAPTEAIATVFLRQLRLVVPGAR